MIKKVITLEETINLKLDQDKTILTVIVVVKIMVDTQKMLTIMKNNMEV